MMVFFSVLMQLFPSKFDSLSNNDTDPVKVLLVARDFGIKPGRLWHVSRAECFGSKEGSWWNEIY
jgi:hypothetical protein